MRTHPRPRAILLILAALTATAVLAASGCARGPSSDLEREAVGAIEAYFTGFNAEDIPAMRDSLHYPHVRLASGGVTIFETPADYDLDYDAFKARDGGWKFSTLDKVRVIQASENKVHFAITFTRHRPGGEAYATHNSMWIVILKDGRWGVRARSSYAQ